MCGCGTTEWCEGGCPCGCDHGTPKGMERQGRYFALQYRDMSERAADAYERGKRVQLTRDDRRSLAAMYGWEGGQMEEIMHVKEVIAEHYKVAPKAALPLLRALGYETETPA